MRALIRPLFSFPTSDDPTTATTLVADAAAEIPTEDNGGISADGLTYTVKIRDGVAWNTPSGARQVTARDAVQAFQRLCNPRLPSPQLPDFIDLIKGLKAYCDGFAKVDPTVAAFKKYMQDNPIDGVKASDDSTVVYTLTRRSSEFLSKLTLTPAAPQPAEYLEYLPDAPELRQATVSDGPYVIQTYRPSQGFVLTRNPSWDPATDPVRKAYVDQIEITTGQDNAAVHQQISAGTVDLQWGDASTPDAEIPVLLANKDPRIFLGGSGTILPYLVFNTVSPNQDKAMAKKEVRQAVNYAVNKRAIIQSLGGAEVAEVATQVLPPVSAGYQKIDPFETPNSEGDAAKAKQMLADAGYPNGITLKMLYRNDGPYPGFATILQQDLAKAGITLELQAVNRNAFYSQYLQQPDPVKSGVWDIAPVGWNPGSLYGLASSYFVGTLDGRTAGQGSANYGYYNNDEVNKEMDAAISAATDAEAAGHWAKADEIATEDAAWVPIAIGKFACFRSDRVQNALFNATWHNFDMTMAAVGA
jgi:peptide/nickel transport system substrate-binding protein